MMWSLYWAEDLNQQWFIVYKAFRSRSTNWSGMWIIMCKMTPALFDHFHTSLNKFKTFWQIKDSHTLRYSPQNGLWPAVKVAISVIFWKTMSPESSWKLLALAVKIKWVLRTFAHSTLFLVLCTNVANLKPLKIKCLYTHPHKHKKKGPEEPDALASSWFTML